MKPTKERGRYSRPWHAGAWETCMPFCIVPMYTPLTHTYTKNENNFLPSNKRAAKRNKTFVKKRNTDKFIKQVVDIFSRLRSICAIISGHSCHISSPTMFSLSIGFGLLLLMNPFSSHFVFFPSSQREMKFHQFIARRLNVFSILIESHASRLCNSPRKVIGVWIFHAHLIISKLLCIFVAQTKSLWQRRFSPSCSCRCLNVDDPLSQPSRASRT